ncbi:MAG: hypothetical protein EXS37_12130 [Opitutus sp.]|nr:hypothetical protein [Opitutus sp.]
MSAVCELPPETLQPIADTLARRLGETIVHSPLWYRAHALGLQENRDLLALAVQRGARHYAGLAAAAGVPPIGTDVLPNEELIVLLLHGRNSFEPFLIRAAAELIRHRSIDATRLALASKRGRCQRVLAYIAKVGMIRDAAGAVFWNALLAALGPQRSVPAGVLPHWSRFVALQGMDRTGRDRGGRWIGAAA